MRSFALLCLTIGFCAAPETTRAAGPGASVEPARISTLITGLGDEEFTVREAATTELERIGEPALPALRQAVLTSDDLEVRHRAETLVEHLDYRVVVRELDRLEGTWLAVSAQENGQAIHLDGDAVVRTVIRKGDSVATNAQGAEVLRCAWRIVDATTTPGKADLVTADGRTFRAIFQIDGNTLKYCGVYAEEESARPTDFSTHDGDGRYLCTMKRAR